MLELVVEAPALAVVGVAAVDEAAFSFMAIAGKALPKPSLIDVVDSDVEVGCDSE